MCSYHWDVFLNFRGGDVRNSFVDFLRHGLAAAGVNVFMDDTRLVGRTINQGLHDAIQSSRIAIPIISPNYKQSEWCLDELVEIMDCHGRNCIAVFPVFYRVDIRDVQSLSVSGQQSDQTQLSKWRSALLSVTWISGWKSKKIANGNEAELVDMVVQKVSSELEEMRRQQLPVARNLYIPQNSRSKWQVFLAFRGPDTRYGFTAHLYKGLRKKGINVFIFDNPSLIGKIFFGEIRSAIEESQISIPILSENYACSHWCLDELAQMVERWRRGKQKILPIFYKVSPSDVRGGRFEMLMRSHVQQPSNYGQWKQALESVGSAGGWESEKIDNGREAVLAREVVKEVRRLLGMP